MRYRLALTLTLFAVAPLAAQNRGTPRYADMSSVIVADSAEVSVTDPRVRLRYPEAARQAGTEADVRTLFVLDTMGRVELSTVSFVGRAPQAFRTELCQWFARIELVPLVRNGARRRAFVVNPFRFGVAGGVVEGTPLETGESVRQAALSDGLPLAVSSFESLPHC